jgi:hypothetical protein
MKTRLLASTAVAALVAAAVVNSTNAAPGAMRGCGTIRAGGATWSVVSAGVPCSAGKPLVRKLAVKPHSLYTKLGTFLGLKCVEIAGKAKREIACVSSDGRRSVYGVTKEDA